MLKVWNLSLLVGTFALTTFGTFLTRGSILSSVHAFARSLVGPMYLGFLAVVLAGGFGLIAARSWRLRAEGRIDAVLSREAAFVGNNWALLAITFVVFLGTIFPLVVEATTSRQVTVGGPYFGRTTAPVLLLLLLLMGVGPLVAWRRSSPDQLRRRLVAPAAAGAAVMVVLAAAGVRSIGATLAFGLAVFVGVANAAAIVRGLRAFARATGRGILSSSPAAVARNRRLYGGLVVHLGVALVAVAITASSSFQRQSEVTLTRGERTSFAGYEITYEGMQPVPQPQRMVLVADLAVSKDGRSVGGMTPSLNFYPAASEPIGTPSIRFGLLGDLYSSVIGFEGQGERAVFRFFLNPGVFWLWVGGGIMALGGLLALWPGRRRGVPSPVPVVERELVGAR